MANFDQLYQTDGFCFVIFSSRMLSNETAFGIVMDMLAIKVFQFTESIGILLNKLLLTVEGRTIDHLLPHFQ